MRILWLLMLITTMGYSQENGKEFKYYVISLDGFVKNSKSNSFIEFHDTNTNYLNPPEENCLNIHLSNEDRIQLLELFENYELFETPYWFHPKHENEPDSMVVAGSVYKVVDGKLTESYDQEISVSNDTYLFFQINYDTPGHGNVNFAVIKEKSRARRFLKDLKVLFGKRVCTEEIVVK